MQSMIRFKFTVFVFGLIASTSYAHSGNGAAENSLYCGFLLKSQPRIDADAAPLVKGIYNLLAREFRELEVKDEKSDQVIDVVAEFNSRQALPGAVVAEARITTVSLSEVNQSLDPVSFGIEDRRVRADALKLEKSERSEVLERLALLVRRISEVRKSGGESGAEFAKIFRGKAAIAEYVKHTPLQMRGALRNSEEDSADIDIEVSRGQENNRILVDLWLAGFESTPISQTHSRMTVWMFPLSSRSDKDGFEMTLPNWLVAPVSALMGIWIFPGKMGVDLVESLSGHSARVNHWLNYLVSYTDLGHISAPSQWVYSGTAVIGLTAYRLVDFLKRKFSRAVPIVKSIASAANISTEPPPPAMQAIVAQQFAVAKLLIDVVRSKEKLGEGSLVHWGTNYQFKGKNLAFDLLLFEQDGEPTLIVVNKEI